MCIDTYQNGSNPSANFVGSPTDRSAGVPDHLNWLATQTVAQDLRGTNAFTVTLDDGILTVDMDGSEILSAAVDVGPEALVGFSGGDGSVTDTHSVSRDVDPLHLTPPPRRPGPAATGRRRMARTDRVPAD